MILPICIDKITKNNIGCQILLLTEQYLSPLYLVDILLLIVFPNPDRGREVLDSHFRGNDK